MTRRFIDVTSKVFGEHKKSLPNRFVTGRDAGSTGTAEAFGLVRTRRRAQPRSGGTGHKQEKQPKIGAGPCLLISTALCRLSLE